MYGSKLTWFDQNWLGLIKIDLFIFVRAENYLFLMWRSIDLVFVWVVEFDLVFVCGPKITWFCCENWTWFRFCVSGRDWLDFIVEDQTWLDFSAGIGNDLVFVWGSKTTWFLFLDRNQLGFCVEASKLTWIYSGIEIYLMSLWRIEIDLISVSGSELSYLCGGQKWLGFGVWIKINLFFRVEASKLTWI